MVSKLIVICSEEQTRFFPDDVLFILNRKSFDHFFKFGKNKIKDTETGIIIHGELRWGNLYYSDFLGLDLIFELRAVIGSKSPVIVTSMFPHLFLEYERELSKYSYQSKLRYFNDPSVSFSPLSDLIECSIEEIKHIFTLPLDTSLLQDLRLNVYNTVGFFDSLFETLIKKLINESKNSYSRIEIINLLDAQLEPFAREINFINTLKSIEYDLGMEMESVSSDDLILFFQQLKSRIIAQLSNEKSIQEADRIRRLQTVYFSHNNVDLDRMYNELLKFGMIVHKTSSIDGLISILNEYKEITVIIADNRFYEKNTKRLSRIQGYHLPKKTLESLGKIFEFILINDNNTIYFPSSANQKHITLFSRKILHHNNFGYSLLGQRIFEKHKSVEMRSRRVPTLGQAMELYHIHINAGDFSGFEREISDFVLRSIKRILSGDSNIEIIDGVSGNLKTNSEQVNLNNFRAKIKARRLALAICQLPNSYLPRCKNLSDKWGVIDSIIRNGSLSKTADKTKVQSFVGKYLLKLKTKKSYPWREALYLNITPEERIWLQEYGYKLETTNFTDL